MNDSLYVFFADKKVGVLQQEEGNEISFQYSMEWLEGGLGAISVSLPLREEKYTARKNSFFANLLPEGDFRIKIERLFQISSGNDFALLQAIGGDCAGALSIGSEQYSHEESYYTELSRIDLHKIITGDLHTLYQGTATRLSLAGAQEKVPIYYDGERFHLPNKGAASSHIIKFNRFANSYARLVENEFLMTRIAYYSSLPVIECELLAVESSLVLLSKRYDRSLDEQNWLQRIHQEDFCQIFNVAYHSKYEKEGGPSFSKCIAFVRKHLSLLEVERLLDWFLFNFILGNSDAHAKNISILYDANWNIRLAPFYDLICTSAYKRVDRNMAMSLGERFDPDIIGLGQWEQFAKDIGVSFPFLRRKFSQLLERIVQAYPKALEDIKQYVPLHEVSLITQTIEKRLDFAQKKQKDFVSSV